MRKKVGFVLLTLGFALTGCVTAPQAPEPGMLLYQAASGGIVSDVSAALDKNAPIDGYYSGKTALATATYYGYADVVKLLLDRGAGIDLNNGFFMNGRGPTALSFAAMKSHAGIVKILIAKGADIQKAIDGLERQSELSTPYAAQGDASHSKTINECKAGIKMLNGLQINPEPASSAAAQVLSVPASISLSPNYSNVAAFDDYAIIVGIEKYPDLPAATYAERDAAAAKNFIRAMGVPERNIMFLTGNRATKTGMEKMLEAWLPNNVSEKSRVYFYYSGHGAPDTKTGDAYLVPSDGDPQYLAQTGYPLKRLYSKLGELKAKSVLVALDSCFSGAGGRSVLAKGTRPLVGKVDMAVQAEGKISVISASAGDQISGANDEAGYGLFTYNLLQGLNGAAKDPQGQVTLKSLYGYLKPRVQDEARRGNREQTPQLQSNGEDFILRAK